MEDRQVIALAAAYITTQPPGGTTPPTPEFYTKLAPLKPGARPRRYILDVESRGEGYEILRSVEESLYDTDDLDMVEGALLEHGLEHHFGLMKGRYLDHVVWQQQENDYHYLMGAWREAAWRVEVARLIGARLGLER